jgi:hypothetical protein
MQQFFYEYQGLRVRSSIMIPEWAPFQSSERTLPIDVSVSLCPEFDAELILPNEGEYRFFVEEVGWFLIRGGVEILVVGCQPEPSRRLRLCLVGSAWGAILYQRSVFFVHASGVVTEGGAVLFCGRQGQGKSTLAAGLVERGFGFICDDLCRVTLDEDKPPTVYPSIPAFKLGPDAARELALSPGEPITVQGRPRKSHYARPFGTIPEPVPLRSLYLLIWGETRLIQLRGFTALNRTFQAATWRGQTMAAAGDPVEYFRQCAQLVHRIPVWEFRRPQLFADMPATTELLLDHLRS